jgi:putative ABC transport system permease protein
MRFLRQLLYLLRKRRFDEELGEEMRLHIDMRSQQLGDPAAARRQFGNLPHLQEISRDAWRWRWLEEALQDTRFAIRLLHLRPGFTAVAVLTLATGIGAATSVFSVVEAVLLRPLPYHDPDRLVAIWDTGTRDRNLSKIFGSYTDFVTFEGKAHSFAAVSAATWAKVQSRVLTGNGPARHVLAIPASAGFFKTLGVTAAIGRTFAPQDEGRGCAIVLAHRYWNEELGADPAIPGKHLILDQKSCAVLGVMPPEFRFYPPQTQMWVMLGPEFDPPREHLMVGIFARLKTGVTIAQAQSEASALHRALHQADGEEREIEPTVNELHGEFTFLAGRTLRVTLLVVLGAVTLLLLIACLNVANLLLGRLSERQRELAVRAALGSGQSRLVRQVLTEGLLLAGLGAFGGLGVAVACIRYFRFANPIELTVGADVRLDLPVLLFSGALTLGTALLFGAVPAFRAARVDLTQRLKSGGRGPLPSGLRWSGARLIVGSQMALSLVLLMGAGLLIRSALGMQAESLGFDPNGVVATTVSLPVASYVAADRRVRLYDQLQRRLQQVQGIESVALASKFPPYVGGNQQLEIRGRLNVAGGGPHDVGADAITPQYFALLRAPLLRGRAFHSNDRSGNPEVAMVNQALVERYFPNADPLGQQIRLAGGPMPWLTVVGVVGSLKHTELMNEMQWVETPILYRPLAQEPRAAVQIGLRVQARDTALVTRAAVAQIRAADPALPVNSMSPLTSDIAKILAYPRFRATVMTFFAASALFLSAVGLHGVLSQIVGQRTAEFGVRRAVGAQTRDLLLLVARQGGAPVVIGAACGALCTLMLRRLLTELLYGLRPFEPGFLGAVSFVLLAVAAAAIAMPAYRAARVDPLVALRHE